MKRIWQAIIAFWKADPYANETTEDREWREW